MYSVYFTSSTTTRMVPSTIKASVARLDTVALSNSLGLYSLPFPHSNHVISGKHTPTCLIQGFEAQQSVATVICEPASRCCDYTMRTRLSAVVDSVIWIDGNCSAVAEFEGRSLALVSAICTNVRQSAPLYIVASRTLCASVTVQLHRTLRSHLCVH